LMMYLSRSVTMPVPAAFSSNADAVSGTRFTSTAIFMEPPRLSPTRTARPERGNRDGRAPSALVRVCVAPHIHHLPLPLLAHLPALVLHLDVEDDDPRVRLARRALQFHRLHHANRVADQDRALEIPGQP